MKTVYVKGYAPSNMIGRIIAWFSDSGGRFATSHVSFLFPKDDVEGADDLLEFEAVTPRCVIHPYDHKGRKGIMYFCQVSEQSYKRMVHMAYLLNGTPYDKMGLLRFLTRGRIQDPRKWFCSESVSRIFRAGGVPLSRKPDEKMKPYDVVTSGVLTPVTRF